MASHQNSSNGNESRPMPVLFVGHGSPMNAIEENAFTRQWRALGETLPVPRAIVCVSAHWETKGTFVTAMENPRTIHDFYGFPERLFEVQYPAPGSKEIVAEAASEAKDQEIRPDLQWGLDHGTWSVLKHLFPKADIPVVQLSLDYSLDPVGHYDLAQSLAGLRRKGIMIIGSGNMVHNLRLINWNMPDSGTSWAAEAESLLRASIERGAYTDLLKYTTMGKEINLAVPTPEHFLPLLYILAMKKPEEKISWFNEKQVYGSISMTSLIVNS